MIYTAGIDVGCGSVKSALFSFDNDGINPVLLGTQIEKIRKRNVKEVIDLNFKNLLLPHQLNLADLAYVATTGEGELVDFRRGHFYSMTAHSRGGLFLNPEVRSIVDVGALHARVILMNHQSRVLDYQMTSQCASGSGQFLENIARYLGVSLEEVGPLSVLGVKPEMVSGICAVLAETDVINMVSRGISTANILKGIHLSIGKRLINLLKKIKAEGKVLITGGLAADTGFVLCMNELALENGLKVEIFGEPLSIYAGGIGAALWGCFRHIKLLEKEAA